MKTKVPVALFAYARPDHLKRTLEGLKRNHVPLIYAFSDGPKNSDLKPPVNHVRQILRKIDWCDVRLIERENNLGLGSSIRSGVAEVLKEYDRLIVVEDDIVLRPGAYDYTVAALEHYKDDPKVMSISMWSDSMFVPYNNVNGFFSKRFMCWGWGTYRNEWTKYIGDPLEIYQECERRNIDVLSWGEDIKWQAEHAAERNLWYVGYALTHFLYSKISYFPNQTLTVNIGRDGSGENEGGSGKKDDLSFLHIPVHLPNKWADTHVLLGLDKKFLKYFTSRKKPLFRRFRAKLGIIKNFILNRNHKKRVRYL